MTQRAKQPETSRGRRVKATLPQRCSAASIQLNVTLGSFSAMGRRESNDADKKGEEEADRKKRSDRHHHRRGRDDRKHSRRDDDDGEDGDERRRSRKKQKRSSKDDAESDGDEDRKRRSSSKKDRRDRKEERHRRSHGKKKKDRKEPSSSSRKKHHKDKKKSKDRDGGGRDDEQKKKPSKKEILRRKEGLTSLGDRFGTAPSELLDPDKDYFAYHQHLFLYLYRDEGVVFNDLTSDETHEAFARFCEKYNAGDLESAYYDNNKGLPAAALEECKTTQHSWSFRTSETENRSLRALQEGVRKQTEYDVGAGGVGTAGAAAATATKSALASGRTGPNVPARDEAEDDRRKERSAEDRYRDRVGNRRLREHARAVEEELSGGRKDGRERQIEKRKEAAAKIHGAARDREAVAASIEVSDDVLYGADGAPGDVDFQSALAREKKRSAQRDEKRRMHLDDLQRKEKEKQEEMLKKLGLSGVKQKIQIAPRNDNP